MVATKEYLAQYRESHKEEIASQKRDYRERKAEQLHKKEKEYRDSHKQQISTKDKMLKRKKKAIIQRQNQEYYLNNLDRFRDSGGKYRARRRESSVQNDSDQRRKIYRRAKEEKRVFCYLCGKLIPKGKRHVDHIIPLSKGGAHWSSNLAISCDSCNLSKKDKHPKQVGLLLWN